MKKVDEKRRGRWAYAAFGIGLGTAAVLYFTHPPTRELFTRGWQLMAGRDITGMRDYLRSFGVWAPVVSSLLMVLQAIVAPLPAFVITFSNGLLFGWKWGAALSWSSSMAGAALCFYIGRLFGRPPVERLTGEAALASADRFITRYGRHSIFLARIIPVISFDVVSYAAGLTSIGFWEFFAATGLGQLPATLLYSYLGQSATGSAKYLFIAFVVVATFVVVGAGVRKATRARAGPDEPGVTPKP